MVESKQKVKELCDNLMQVSPCQIIIDLVQEEIEDRLYSDDVTPDEIGALVYGCSILSDVYNPELKSDLEYLNSLHNALVRWEKDATFANKTLGIDPNK